MKYVEPKLKVDDLKLYESFNRQFLSHFKEAPKGLPRVAIDTCDTHLKLMQPLKFIDPKGNPTDEVTWSEPRDQTLFWRDKIRFVWLGISISCFFFFLMIFYFWGK